jgi:hypothetical protein
MEVGDQLYPFRRIGCEFGDALRLFWTVWRKVKSLPVPAIEALFLSHPARYVFDLLNEMSWLRQLLKTVSDQGRKT